MVGQHLERGRIHVRSRCLTRCGLDQVLEQVDFVVAMRVLQYRRDALEAHAGVDRGLGQRVHDARLVAVELHEDVVPNFDVAVAVFIGRSGRAAGNLRAVVVEDFGTGTAGSGIAHHPEIVGRVARTLVVADADAALGSDADLLGPDVECLVVLGIDRDPQLVRRQLEHHRQQFPGVVDGVALEVIAEAEVAQHLEKSVMSGRVADILEIVVLAAGAYAFLRGRGASVRTLVEAEENILELVHAGIGEQERRIVERHQRTGSDDLMAPGGKEVEEGLANLGTFHGGRTRRAKALILREQNAKSPPDHARRAFCVGTSLIRSAGCTSTASWSGCAWWSCKPRRRHTCCCWWR